MKIRLLDCIIAIAGILGASCSAVHADDFAPLPMLGNTVLDFDSGNGKYSDWQIKDLGTINALRMTLQAHRLGDDPRWAPGFTITVGSANDKVAFQILSATRQPPLTMHLAHYIGDKVVDDQPFTSTIGLDENLDVAIDWTPAGVVTIRLGSGETHTATLKGAPTSLGFAGSTGEVEFNPLRIGHSGP